MNGFDQYLWQQIFPIIVCIPFDDRFDISDGKTSILLRTISDLQILLSQNNVAFEIYPNLLINQLKISPQHVEIFLSNLKQNKPKFFEFYEKFLKSYKTKTL